MDLARIIFLFFANLKIMPSANDLAKEVAQQLPIAACKEELLAEIKTNSVTIIIGETGSGKTTQIPQYLSKTMKGVIAVTQPRRVAAISLAQRVSQEMGTLLGQECGYAVRFDNKTSKNTRIKYMTDGLLLKEYVARGSNFDSYSCIILDEAHERTLRTDILFGLVKRELAKRPNDFKVVIMSATLDADSFSTFFNGCV
jgi:HrpA-like RNA helicase